MSPAHIIRKSFLAAVVAVSLGSVAHAEQTVWRFDNVKTIGGFEAKAEGAPRLVDSPVGEALQFDGKADSIFVAGRPLVGASTFTLEVIFRPEGGPFGQRFLHIAETDPATGRDALPTGTGDPNPRFMFEVRVVDGAWYLDTYVKSKAGAQTLIFPEKKYPLNKWYAAAQTFDGKTYRAYVNGELLGEAAIAYAPQGPGHVRAGARMNNIEHFTGSIAQARFTDRALRPDELLKVEN